MELTLFILVNIFTVYTVIQIYNLYKLVIIFCYIKNLPYCEIKKLIGHFTNGDLDNELVKRYLKIGLLDKYQITLINRFDSKLGESLKYLTEVTQPPKGKLDQFTINNTINNLNKGVRIIDELKSNHWFVNSNNLIIKKIGFIVAGWFIINAGMVFAV